MLIEMLLAATAFTANPRQSLADAAGELGKRTADVAPALAQNADELAQAALNGADGTDLRVAYAKVAREVAQTSADEHAVRTLWRAIVTSYAAVSATATAQRDVPTAKVGH